MCMRTHEEIISIRAETADFEELHQVEKLAMDVTAYLCNTSSDGQRVATVSGRTVTGESTTCTFPSSMRISLALRHNRFTCSSEIGSQRVNCSICLKPKIH